VRDLPALRPEDGALFGGGRGEVRGPIRYRPGGFGIAEGAGILEVGVTTLEVDPGLAALMAERTGACPGEIDRELEGSIGNGVKHWHGRHHGGGLQVPGHIELYRLGRGSVAGTQQCSVRTNILLEEIHQHIGGIAPRAGRAMTDILKDKHRPARDDASRCVCVGEKRGSAVSLELVDIVCRDSA